MKHIGLIIWTLIFTSFSVFGQLNKQIDRSQIASLKNSPFETAKSMTSELKIQKKYRIQYVMDLDNLISKFPNDTIILAENYDFICFGCPADNIQILVDTTLTNYRKDSKYKTYGKTIEILPKKLTDQSAYFQSDLFELRDEIRMNDNWNEKPEKYGTDKCFDGGHTFYTVFYPDRHMISMYMRCWIPKDIRKRTDANNNP